MEPSESPRSNEAEEQLRRLEERLLRASEAAERLMAEAAQAGSGSRQAADAGEAQGADAGAAPKPPPAGWQTPGQDERPRSGRGELELLVQVVESLRELVPPELQRRLAEALREVLLAVRALIDWYLERGERQRQAPDEVQDIPIV